MKYTLPFYNLEGIFRYLRGAEALDSTLKATSSSLHSLLTTLTQNRKKNSKWRKLGLWTDDLIIEEHDVVQEALHRIPKDHLHARYSRAKVALHTNMLRRELAESEWVKDHEDVSYLMPFIQQVLKEHDERHYYDTGVFKRSPQ